MVTDGDEAVRLFELRDEPTRELAGQAGAVADACHAMAVRFHRGGKLVVFGAGGHVRAEQPGIVQLKTAFGGTRIVDLLVGDPLPRIC